MNWFYTLSIRIKFLFSSVIVLTLAIILILLYLNLYLDNRTNSQSDNNSKISITIIDGLLKNDVTDSVLERISSLKYVEKISAFNKDESVAYEYNSNDYRWQDLIYYSLKVDNNDEIDKILIATNLSKFPGSNKEAKDDIKYFVIYISILLVLLIILIANLIFVRPIEKITESVNQFYSESEYDDDKSKSRIFELSKTISLLKRNINERKQKEKELINIQNRLASVLNTVGDAIVTAKSDGAIVMVNPAFEKIWGYKKEEILSKNLSDIMPEQYRDAHKTGMKRYLETGKEYVINQTLELEALHSEGNIFPIDIHISETKIDNEIYFTASIKDITERKKIEKELKEAKENVEEQLELRTLDLVTHINELNCLYGLSKLIEDDSHNISYILKETLALIITACHFSNTVSCLIYFNGHDYKTKNYKETKYQIKKDIVIKNKKKGFISICYLEEVHPDSKSQFLPYEEKLLDIICVRLSRYLEHNKAKEDLDNANEALRDAQLQLIQAEKLDTIGTLSAGVAHEVKNPLAVIQLGIDYLNKKSLDNENIKEVIKEMDEAIHRADSVIKELVNFSASNDLSFEKLNVNNVIDDSLSLVKHEIIKNNIEINKNYYVNLDDISADKQKLEQVIINLIINATHAMEASEEKSIKIRTYPSTFTDLNLDMTGQFNFDDKMVVISIEDSGSGIDKNKIDKIFDPFYTTKPSGKGTGLGLTVCQNIIRLHGGILKFSHAESGGAIATIMLKV